jgi:DNA-binding response OmpR family regulator
VSDPRPVIRVLLVDDDEDDALLTRGLLAEVTQVEFDLEWARTFEDGVERLRQGVHEVALVDWRLGTHDGIELIRLAADSGWPAPVILLTGRGGHAVDLAAMEAGAADFLSKTHLTADSRAARSATPCSTAGWRRRGRAWPPRGRRASRRRRTAPACG